MFGLVKRARAEASTTVQMAEIVRLIEQRWGSIPEHVWLDPYVAKFMTLLIHGLLKASSDGSYIDGDGMGLARVWQKVTGYDPLPLLKASMFQEDDAKRGGDDAALWLVFFNRHPNLSNAVVKEVFDAAQEMDRVMLSQTGEAADTMATACSIVFQRGLMQRVGEII